MYGPVAIGWKFLQYYTNAANGKGHGIHSPFVYDFVVHVLRDQRRFYAYDQVEGLRRILLEDRSAIKVNDLGAGSVTSASATRTIRAIARSAAKPRKLAQLLFRIAHYYQCGNMLELGTSLGITGAYLSLGNPEGSVTTIEGSPAIAAKAEIHFKELGLSNILQHTGNFDAILPRLLAEGNRYDLAYVDGNHRYEPTIRYFQQLVAAAPESAVLIFDDVHWSAEMEQAWNEIRNDPRVMLSIDIFFLGFVFIRPEFRTKQHFSIRF